MRLPANELSTYSFKLIDIMKDSEVHSLILDKTDEIEEDEFRSFIREILKHERTRLDQERPKYAEKYHQLIEDYATNESLDSFVDK